MLTNFHNSSNLSGIYKITNSVNDRIYIGSCKRFKERAYKHIHTLERNKHSNKHLQNAFNLYGSDSFTFEVIEVVSGTKEDRKLREQEYLNSYLNRWDLLYNIRKDAQSPEGCKQPEVFRSEQSNRMKERMSNQSVRDKMSDTIRQLWKDGVYDCRKSNSESYKQLWADQTYREKMIERRRNCSQKVWDELPHDIKLLRKEKVRRLGLMNRKHPRKAKKERLYRLLHIETNTVFEIDCNFSKWCRENGCLRQELNKTLSGKVKQHRGYRRIK